MSVDRARVAALVRAELSKHLRGAAESGHPAFGDIADGPDPGEHLDDPMRPACVIEPERACIRSGYCKKLGY